MRILIITLLPIFLLMSCIKTTILKNGHQKAALNPKVYKNRIFFDKSILSEIDTTVIFEEYNTSFYISGKPVNVFARFNYQDPNTIYGVYRFYGNGCFNYFGLDRDSVTLTKKMFDPTYTGWRGVFYKAKGEIRGDLITQIDQIGSIGTMRVAFEFKGDTLFVKAKGQRERIYIKRKIANELLSFNAEW